MSPALKADSLPLGHLGSPKVMSTGLPKVRQGTGALPTTSQRGGTTSAVSSGPPSSPAPGAVQERLGLWWVLYLPQGPHPLLPAEKVG